MMHKVFELIRYVVIHLPKVPDFRYFTDVKTAISSSKLYMGNYLRPILPKASFSLP